MNNIIRTHKLDIICLFHVSANQFNKPYMTCVSVSLPKGNWLQMTFSEERLKHLKERIDSKYSHILTLFSLSLNKYKDCPYRHYSLVTYRTYFTVRISALFIFIRERCFIP